MSGANASPTGRSHQKMSRAIHRREFLKVSIGAGGGLLLGFRLAGTGETLAMQNGSAASFTPNAFVRIGTDERVTVIVNHSEMGSGCVYLVTHASCRGARCRLEQCCLRVCSR